MLGKIGLSLGIFVLAAVGGSGAAQAGPRTIIYDGKVTQVESAPIQSKVTRVETASTQSNDLWITTADLARATGFVIKPQGVCRDELCFPLPKGRKGDFVTSKGGTTWFNLTAFAALIKQPVAVDAKNSMWAFGRRPDVQANLLNTLEAPDFKLADMNGRVHSLSEFRGKKVLLVTWASW